MTILDKKITILAVIVVIIVVIAAAAAIMASGSDDDDNKGSSDSTITVTDLAGREVTLDLPVDRIVCGDAESMTMVASIAGEDFVKEVVGYDSNLDNYFPDLKKMWTSAGIDFSKIKGVGSFINGDFNWETVAGLEPDVVFIPVWCYTYGMVPEDTIKNMANAGIPIVTLDLYVNRLDLDTMKKNCDLLGTIFDNAETADKAYQFYAEQVNAVKDKLSQVTPEKYTYYYEQFAYLNSYGATPVSDSTITIFLNQKSLVPLGSSTTISAEAFATGNVSFVFLDTMSYTEIGSTIGWGATVTDADLEKIRSGLSARAGWSEAPAVKDDKVYFMDYMSQGGTFDQWLYYQFYAKTMFPEIYGDLDPISAMEGYYKEFLPWVDHKGVWYYSIDGSVIGATS